MCTNPLAKVASDQANGSRTLWLRHCQVAGGWVSVFPAISYGVTGSLVSERGRSALEALTFLRDAFGIDWTKQESSFVRSWRWEIIETAVGQSAILPITLVAELPAKGSIRDDSIQ